MATQPNPALEATVQAMLAPVSAADQRASAREALSRKCPRFVPSSEPVLPMMSPRYWARRYVENVPHTDDGVALTFGGIASAASMKAA